MSELTKVLGTTSLKQVRQEAAKTIMDLRNGNISPLVADAIYKQSLTIVDSYRVELRAIELAINSSNAGMSFEKASTLINTLEVANK